MHLKQLEDLLYQFDVQQGVIIRADFNYFTDNLRDQKGNAAKPHYRTKATKYHTDWKTNHKFHDIYRHNNPEGRDLAYLKDGNDRKRVDKGTRIDKLLVTEDLPINEVTFFHIRDYYYAEEFGMTDNVSTTELFVWYTTSPRHLLVLDSSR